MGLIYWITYCGTFGQKWIRWQKVFVRILDNLSTGSMDNIKPILDQNANVEFMLGDITDLTTCHNACANITAICHQAAIGSVPKSINDPLDIKQY